MGKISHRARRRLSLLVLLVGLPLYVVAAVTLVAQFDRPGIWLELMIYVGLGVLWALPLRFVFRGIGRSAAEADGPDGR